MKKLTEEQEKKFKEYSNYWVENVAKNTDRIDKEKAKEAVRLAYTCAELTPPTEFRFVSSPLALQKEGNKINGIDGFQETYYCLYGSMDAGWISFYDFFVNETDIEGMKKMRGLVEVTRECGWVLCGEDIAVISDRPTEIHIDDEFELHNPNGPVLLYEDGFKLYALHGNSMPEWVIEEKNRDESYFQKVLALENVTQRLLAIKYLGLHNFLNMLDYKTITEKDGYEIIDLKISEGENSYGRYLKMINPSTGEIHVEGIDNNITTIEGALSWRQGIDVKDYTPPKFYT